MNNTPPNQPNPSPYPEPAPKSLSKSRASQVSLDIEQARAMHTQHIPAIIYGVGMHPLIGEEAEPAARSYAQDVVTRMAPRDPAEEMLIAQLLYTHTRVIRLTALANQQTAIAPMGTLHEYADRASNTYRRLMLALAEYRRPPRAGDTFAVVKQANIAGQQVVQNIENFPGNTTNEQGCRHGRPATSPPAIPSTRSTVDSPTTDSTALPAHAGGAGVSASISRAGEAVGASHGPKDAGRQGSIACERDKAR